MSKQETTLDTKVCAGDWQLSSPALLSEQPLLGDVRDSIRLSAGVATGRTVTTASAVHLVNPVVAERGSPLWWEGGAAEGCSITPLLTMAVGQTAMTSLPAAGGAACGQRCEAAGRYVDGGGGLTVVPDSLGSELCLELSASLSPGAMLLYEPDLSSPECAPFVFADPSAAAAADFDLEPQFERSDDLEKLGVKMEDAFVDQSDIAGGPTLAALNAGQSWMDELDDVCVPAASVGGCGSPYGRHASPCCAKPAATTTSRYADRAHPTVTCAFARDVAAPPFDAAATDTRLSLTGLLVKQEPGVTGERGTGVKRPRSPELQSSDTMDRKWEEIKQFIDDNILRQEQQQQEQQQTTMTMFSRHELSSPTRPMSLFPAASLSTPALTPMTLSPAMSLSSAMTLSPLSTSSSTMTAAAMSQVSPLLPNEPSASLTLSSLSAGHKFTGDVAFTVKEEVESQDEGFDSEDSDDMGAGDDLDYFSDSDSLGSRTSLNDEPQPSGRKGSRSSHEFWQYNTQSKGPKGKRLCQSMPTKDPHILNNFEDPVFDQNINQTRYKHSGKARRGDGNDITPNPRKLHQLGNELDRLARRISDLSPHSHQPASVRSRSRKEKNKFASRACRLKKKAQHEANKVKLHGLEREHNELMQVLEQIKDEICDWLKTEPQRSADRPKLAEKLQRLMDSGLSNMIAGYTTDYVNLVVEKVSAGDPTGGLRGN